MTMQQTGCRPVNCALPARRFRPVPVNKMPKRCSMEGLKIYIKAKTSTHNFSAQRSSLLRTSKLDTGESITILANVCVEKMLSLYLSLFVYRFTYERMSNKHEFARNSNLIKKPFSSLIYTYCITEFHARQAKQTWGVFVVL